MKKILLMAIASVFLFELPAQITLNQETHTPLTGSSYKYIFYSPSPIGSFSLGSSGANQTWDLSSLETGNDITYEYQNIFDSESASNYPNATKFLQFDIFKFEGERFINTNSDGVFDVGFLGVNEQGIYTNPRKILEFPMTFGDSYIDVFSGQVEVFLQGTAFDRVGEITVSADGYGDLILPYVTVDNVLRVKISGTYSDSLGDIPIGEEKEDLAYMWYSLDMSVPLAYYSRHDALCFNATYISIIKESDLVLSATELYTPIFNMSPNPATSSITFHTDVLLEDLAIYDLNAKKVKSFGELQDRKTFNISDLMVGIYYVRYSVNGFMFTEKLVIL